MDPLKKIALKNNSGLDNPMEFYKLDRKTQDALLYWISTNLTERKGYNHRITSYGLKHLLPYYVTNGAFKGAMLKAGYRVVDETERNWRFNVYIRKGRKNENIRFRKKN